MSRDHIVTENAGLTELDRLKSLTTIGDRLEISFNYLLTDVHVLNSLESVGGSVLIRDNGLSQAAKERLVNQIEVIDGFIQISGRGHQFKRIPEGPD